MESADKSGSTGKNRLIEQKFQAGTRCCVYCFDYRSGQNPAGVVGEEKAKVQGAGDREPGSVGRGRGAVTVDRGSRFRRPADRRPLKGAASRDSIHL